MFGERQSEHLARALQRGNKGGLAAFVLAVELHLLGQLFRAIGFLVAQTDVAIEPQSERAGFVLEQLVDDRAFAQTGGLKERDFSFAARG